MEANDEEYAEEETTEHVEDDNDEDSMDEMMADGRTSPSAFAPVKEPKMDEKATSFYSRYSCCCGISFVSFFSLFPAFAI